jgi:hypothetical protein
MALIRPKITQLDTAISAFSDPITVVNTGSTSANVDIGVLYNRANGLVSNVALFWDESGNTFATAFTSNTGITNSNILISSYANLTVGTLSASNISLDAQERNYVLAGPGSAYSFDGSSLSGWDTLSSSVDATDGNPAPSIELEITGSRIKRNFGDDFRGKTIQFDVYMITGAEMAVIFGSNEAGDDAARYALSITQSASLARDGFAADTNGWTSTAYGPSTVGFTAETWYTIRVELGTGSNGWKWYVDGVQQADTYTEPANFNGTWFGFLTNAGATWIDNILVTPGPASPPVFRALTPEDLPKLTTPSIITTSNTTTSTSSTTGAVVVGGGAGIAGNVNIGANLTVAQSGLFRGPYNESSTLSGVFVGNTGAGVPSPRVGFFNGNTQQNWQIDNFGGAFRWFVPGSSKMTLYDSGNLNVTGGYTVGGKKAVNGPAFRAYISTGQTIASAGAQVKVTFGAETFDTDGCFASSAFTPTVEGYYQLNATVRISGTSGTGENMLVLYKNGGEYARGTNGSGTEIGASFYSMQVSDIVYANGTTDFFEVYLQQGSGSDRDTTAGTNISYFSGVMVRGA